LFSSKNEIKNKNEVLWSISMARSQGKKKKQRKNCHIFYLNFQCVAINIEGSLDSCTSYMVYSPEVSKSS
jgi:hypothetical protein